MSEDALITREQRGNPAQLQLRQRRRERPRFHRAGALALGSNARAVKAMRR